MSRSMTSAGTQKKHFNPVVTFVVSFRMPVWLEKSPQVPFSRERRSKTTGSLGLLTAASQLGQTRCNPPGTWRRNGLPDR